MEGLKVGEVAHRAGVNRRFLPQVRSGGVGVVTTNAP
jgi:hypothetical protein